MHSAFSGSFVRKIAHWKDLSSRSQTHKLPSALSFPDGVLADPMCALRKVHLNVFVPTGKCLLFSKQKKIPQCRAVCQSPAPSSHLGLRCTEAQGSAEGVPPISQTLLDRSFVYVATLHGDSFHVAGMHSVTPFLRSYFFLSLFSPSAL